MRAFRLLLVVLGFWALAVVPQLAMAAPAPEQTKEQSDQKQKPTEDAQELPSFQEVTPGVSAQVPASSPVEILGFAAPEAPSGHESFAAVRRSERPSRIRQVERTRLAPAQAP